MANRINIPPTPKTRNITIIMVSLSDSFTVMWLNLSKTEACITVDNLTKRMQVQIVIDEKRERKGRWSQAQNFHKYPQEPQDFQKKKKKSLHEIQL